MLWWLSFSDLWILFMLQVAAIIAIIVDAKLDLSPAHHRCPALQVSGCPALPLLFIGWTPGRGSRSSKHDLGDFICNDHPSPMIMNDQQQLAIICNNCLFHHSTSFFIDSCTSNPKGGVNILLYACAAMAAMAAMAVEKADPSGGFFSTSTSCQLHKTCCTVWFLAGSPPWRTVLGQLPSCGKWFGMWKVRCAKSGNPGPSSINSGGTKQAPSRSFFLGRSQVSVSIYLWNLIKLLVPIPFVCLFIHVLSLWVHLSRLLPSFWKRDLHYVGTRSTKPHEVVTGLENVAVARDCLCK